MDARYECPECFKLFDAPDEVAIHLVDKHHWAHDKAAVFLREAIEEEAFYNEP